ncbi:unnamed protein product, partial [Nesidiocoris tenuis]
DRRILRPPTYRRRLGGHAVEPVREEDTKAQHDRPESHPGQPADLFSQRRRWYANAYRQLGQRIRCYVHPDKLRGHDGLLSYDGRSGRERWPFQRFWSSHCPIYCPLRCSKIDQIRPHASDDAHQIVSPAAALATCGVQNARAAADSAYARFCDNADAHSNLALQVNFDFGVLRSI